MLKRASESVIVVFSKSIVCMMSQNEVKSGNRGCAEYRFGCFLLSSSFLELVLLYYQQRRIRGYLQPETSAAGNTSGIIPKKGM